MPIMAWRPPAGEVGRMPADAGPRPLSHENPGDHGRAALQDGTVFLREDVHPIALDIDGADDLPLAVPVVLELAGDLLHQARLVHGVYGSDWPDWEQSLGRSPNSNAAPFQQAVHHLYITGCAMLRNAVQAVERKSAWECGFCNPPQAIETTLV